MFPPMRDFLRQNRAISIIQLDNLIRMMGTLSHERALGQNRKDVGKTVCGCESLDILEELMFRDAEERVADSTAGVRWEGKWGCERSWGTGTHSPVVFADNRVRSRWPLAWASSTCAPPSSFS